MNSSGTLIGKIPAGTETYLQNAGFVWLLFLIPLAFAGWFGMNNIRDEHVSPNIGNPLSSFGIITFMLLIALFTAGSGLWLMLPEAANGSGFNVPKEIVLLLVVIATVGLLKLIPGEVGGNLKRQYKIFGNTAYLGDDRYLHHDLWFVYRLCSDLCTGDQGRIWLSARRSGWCDDT